MYLMMFPSNTTVDHTTFIVICFSNSRISHTLSCVDHSAMHLNALTLQSWLLFDYSAMYW